ncbi:MAG: prepilin peptidase [Terriglobia bacterium]|nr:MAG: prepilin peptidase [Terriglobia bacterium]
MIEAVLAFVFGLLIGSFLNVCIYRWPRDLSVVRPRSRCNACEKTIAWHDNIPLLSYALLRGRCRHCGSRISARYPAVELLTGLLFFYFVWTLGPNLTALKMCVFAAILVALIFTDLEERILPDELTLGGTLLGFAFALFVSVPEPSFFTERARWLIGALAGAVVPTFFLWLAGWLYKLVRHREGLGLGDVKLIAMVGSFLGLSGALLTLVAGSLMGSLIGYGYIRATKKDPSTYELPFGTFLGVAALLIGMEARRILAWYGGF